MPRPVYVICASGVVEDRASNLVTIFEAIEAIELTMPEGATASPEKRAKGAMPIEHSDSTTIAVWLMEDGDVEQQFEHEFAIQFDGTEDIVGPHAEFVFKPPAFLQRFKMRMRGFPPVQLGGFVTMVSRVRRAGETAWLAQQSYPIKVTVDHATEYVASVDGHEVS